MMKYVIGLDYGTDSCRAVIVDAAGGREIASAVCPYPRWQAGKYCDPRMNRYRQHPLDYIEVMETSVRAALAGSPEGTPARVAGIAIDTTGSTPVLTDREGTPLALRPEFAENPNAMFILWKDHTAIKEAARINKLAKEFPVDYTKYVGGIYSSEWVWAKALHVLREDPAVREKAYAWVEHCDWMPALLTGNTRPETLRRSRCAAGHKALWHASWRGLPPNAFFAAIDPLLNGFRDHYSSETCPSHIPAGRLTKEWAQRLGLGTDVVVGVGAFDCHFGAVGAQIRPGAFVRVIGTSTCDVMVVPYEEIGDRLIPGICGQVDGSVIPGMVGLEAGQSGFGDIYAWFKRVLAWPLEQIVAASTGIDGETRQRLIDESMEQIIPLLSEEAAKLPVGESLIVATDWMNGRRTPDANQLLRGAITGLTLGSTAPLIFKALVEATAFGSKAIADRFIEHGIAIREVIGIGGISLKSPFVMQTLADVLGMTIKVARVEQACAFGAALFAAVAAGLHPTVEEAQKAMGQGFAFEYVPNPASHRLYMQLYGRYRAIGQFTETLVDKYLTSNTPD